MFGNITRAHKNSHLIQSHQGNSGEGWYTVYTGRHLRLRLIEHRSILKFCSDIRFFHFIWDTAFS
jgi:hypothetical protein